MSRGIVSDDAIYILRAVVEFRDRTGAAPTMTTMAGFLPSVQGLVPPETTTKQLWNKLRHLHRRFGVAAKLPPSNPKERLARDLVSQAWRPRTGGNSIGEEEEDNDGGSEKGAGFDEVLMGELLPCTRLAIEEICKKVGMVSSVPSLEKCISAVGMAKMMDLEEKLRKQLHDEFGALSMAYDVRAEILEALTPLP